MYEKTLSRDLTWLEGWHAWIWISMILLSRGRSKCRGCAGEHIWLASGKASAHLVIEERKRDWVWTSGLILVDAVDSQKERPCSTATYKVYKLLPIKDGCGSLCSWAPLTASLELAPSSLSILALFLLPASFVLSYHPHCWVSEPVPPPRIVCINHTLSALPFFMSAVLKIPWWRHFAFVLFYYSLPTVSGFLLLW